MTNTAARSLIAALDEESIALRTGALLDLPQIADKKSSLLIALESEKGLAADLAKIRAKAARNEALLAAAIKGVQAARDRLAALNEVKTGLNLYSEKGKMKYLKPGATALEKKA